MIKTTELRLMAKEELEYRLKELKEELFNLRFQHATGQLDNPMKLKETRRDIARVCTVITEREYAIHAEAFEEAIRAPRETVEEPEELIEAETEDELAEDAEALFEQEELAAEAEEQREEEVEEELKDL